MMNRQSSRIRIDDDGRLEVVDPGFDSLDLLQAIDPEFLVRSAKLLSFTTPRFLRAKEVGCDSEVNRLADEPQDKLWADHAALMQRIKGGEPLNLCSEGEASVLDLKIELARRVLSNCRLCAHRCGVNRSLGELGICRLGTEGIVAEHFIHIAEESPVNPSLVLNLAGCGLRCRFCQQSTLLAPESIVGDKLGPSLWSSLSTKGARSLSFVGGNPDESLYAILRFLTGAPVTWNLPIVWNCHAFETPETISLLDGVVDAFLPDFKYGSDACGRRLSAIPNYPETAKANIAAMLEQGVLVIVRILVLPGHFECCHAPSLDYLATILEKSLLVSVRDQYCPDWKITARDGALARRVTSDEVIAVRQRARDLGLSLID
jgi:putative pyruvate formate lyase activating enzyme